MQENDLQIVINRTAVAKCYLTDLEYNQLKYLAKVERKTVSDYLRQLINTKL
jgi:hypothetical protein